MNNYRFGVDRSGERREEFREILKEERAEYRGYHPSVRPEKTPDQEPEFFSIPAFVKYMIDETDDDGNVPPFTVEQAEKLSFRLRMSISDVVFALKSAGLLPAKRTSAKEPRGYRSPENKWAHNPTFATSGGEQITGFAGPNRSGRAPELGMTRRHASRFPVQSVPSKLEQAKHIDPKRERERLRLIREGAAVRAETERQLAEKRAAAEASMRDTVRQERLLLRMLGEAEIILKGTGLVKDKIDKSIRFLNIVKLYEGHYGPNALESIANEIAEVRQAFTKLVTG